MDIGRRSRAIPRNLVHALRIRDVSCRFPGCTHTHHTDAYHILHWAQGGETNLANHVTLCRYHHTLLHNSEFQLATNNAGDLAFGNNSGQVITQSFFPQIENLEFIADATVNETSAVCKWAGEKIDVQMVLDGLFVKNKLPIQIFLQQHFTNLSSKLILSSIYPKRDMQSMLFTRTADRGVYFICAI